MLSVRNLTKTYRSAGEQVSVLRGVDLNIAAGESVALTGESGSGKSTLLHLIAGLDRPDNGEIRVADTTLSDLNDAGRAALRRDRLGLVFQQFNLIPSLSVEDNLAFQSRIAGRHEAKWQAELVELRQKGVERAVIDQALEFLDPAMELELALQAGRKKLNSLRGEEPAAARKKLAAALSRREMTPRQSGATTALKN